MYARHAHRPKQVNTDHSGQIAPAVVAGLKIGIWFVRKGFLGYNYPDWMKYLGFYIDFSYHRLFFSRQSGTWTNTAVPVVYQNNFFSEGNAITLAFMFPLRYGFFPDSEVPFGRLQPYIAVGPAILFSSQRPTFYSSNYDWTLKAPSDSTVYPALAVEGGLRWMALKNVSLDASFKYRYAHPSYRFSSVIDHFGTIHNFTFSPTLSLFSFQVGVAYHF
jgi:opacity protein-like surface antigen